MRQQPKEHHKGGHKHIGNDELLEYLKIFSQESGKIPTQTDFKNEFLPSYWMYINRFGTIENARKLAGVYE